MQIDIVYLGKQLYHIAEYIDVGQTIEYRRIKYVDVITTQYQYETV